VILQLVLNSRDAMPLGGKLLIETADLELTEKYVQNHPGAKAGHHAMLAITDEGNGMDDETRRRIFEPIFTTKIKGQSSWLGLASVQGFVAQTGGHITVSSSLGHGSTFKVYLPQSSEEPTEEPVPEGPAMPKGNETILVVEDYEGVRNFAADVLRDCGYGVIEASSGSEALQICSKDPGLIDLVLTDVVMPHMSGRELAATLGTRLPGLRVIFMSGFTGEELKHYHVQGEGSHFIEKPFTPEGLASKVREVLGPRAPSARILVVDDEDLVRSYLRDVLELAGYEVEEAEDGREALDLVRSGKINLLITDLVMPGQEGVETIQQLRREVPGLGIIASSGYGGEFLRMARLLGADAVLPKPVKVDDLLASVQDVLKKRR